MAKTLRSLQHDSTRPDDVLKVDAGEDANGGNAAADWLLHPSDCGTANCRLVVPRPAALVICGYGLTSGSGLECRWSLP